MSKIDAGRYTCSLQAAAGDSQLPLGHSEDLVASQSVQLKVKGKALDSSCPHH